MELHQDSVVAWLVQDHNQVTYGLMKDLQEQFLHSQLHFLLQDNDTSIPYPEVMKDIWLYDRVHKRPCLDDSLGTEELVGHTPMFPLEDSKGFDH
jgi:hypothetical protein